MTAMTDRMIDSADSREVAEWLVTDYAKRLRTMGLAGMYGVSMRPVRKGWFGIYLAQLNQGRKPQRKGTSGNAKR